MKKIINIVIYKSIENGKIVEKSCIFYNDGSIEEGTKQDAIKAIKEITVEKNITHPDQLRKMMNKDIIYTMTEKEFIQRYNSFLPQKELDTEPVKDIIEDSSDENKTEETIESTEKNQETDSATNTDENNDIEVYEEEYGGSSHNDFTLDHDDSIEDNELYLQEDSIFTKLISKIKEKTKEKVNNNSKTIKAIAGVLVVTVGFLGCNYLLKRCSKKGKITDSNITDVTTDLTYNETTKDDVSTTYIVQSNDLYDDYTLSELLDVTNNSFQKSAMINVSSTLNGFNGYFAKNYLESGHDIKAALSFDEIVALQQAYNNYSKDEVKAYFNGHEVNASEISNNYKSASLQLMGAYIIEDKENPVDMSILIDSQEGRDYYNKYHTMFIAAKYAEGEEQIKLVNEFYDSIRRDFPITEDARTEGISHSESYSKLKDYQLSIIPMIDAAEMIFQNLGNEIEDLNTLPQLEISFLNDLSLCNHVDDKFERIETIMLGAYEDDKNPLFDQYRNAIITDLVTSNDHVIDDEHRELSNLRRFQQIVNHDPLWKHRNGEYNGESSANENYKSSIETSTWEETTTTSKTVTDIEPVDIPIDKQKEVDEKTSQENDNEKRKAEVEAERERKHQQQEEDKNKKDIQKDIEEDNKKTQKDIDNANNQINNNNKDTNTSNDKPVNEKDINNVDISDEYTDKDGNINDSVKNITTDGDGYEEDLPDPNKTGFDNPVKGKVLQKTR